MKSKARSREGSSRATSIKAAPVFDAQLELRRAIDALADDLIAIARTVIEPELRRALAKATAVNDKAAKARARIERKQERLREKEELVLEKARAREEKRAAKLAEKERLAREREEEREQRRAEHEKLKQQRLALKQELEAERRRLREARQKPKQMKLDFDGMRPVTRRSAEPKGPAPLFVHKRRRDGQIEQLSRAEAEAAARAATEAAAAAAANDAGAPAPPPVTEAAAAPAE